MPQEPVVALAAGIGKAIGQVLVRQGPGGIPSAESQNCFGSRLGCCVLELWVYRIQFGRTKYCRPESGGRGQAFGDAAPIADLPRVSGER